MRGLTAFESATQTRGSGRAELTAGGRVVRTVRTKALGYAEKVDVDVVQVIATVTDHTGHFVAGLPRTAFHIEEDGKAQKISDFSFHQPVTAGPARQQAPGIISNAPDFKSNSCLNVILLDSINTDFSTSAI